MIVRPGSIRTSTTTGAITLSEMGLETVISVKICDIGRLKPTVSDGMTDNFANHSWSILVDRGSDTILKCVAQLCQRFFSRRHFPSILACEPSPASKACMHEAFEWHAFPSFNHPEIITYRFNRIQTWMVGISTRSARNISTKLLHARSVGIVVDMLLERDAA
jgi:hypothetical protein